MMKGLSTLVLLACYYFIVINGGGIDDTICEQNVCNSGYFDKTGGNTKWWACGENCPGGKYFTDGYCNCACVDRQECEDECKHNRGPCNEGYEDITDGNFNWWACGANCEGGKYYTDGGCNCACKDKPDKCPDGVTCGSQGPCKPGYMDKTNGNYKYWACGKNCQGGTFYTDGGCGCACVNAGQCAIVPGYNNFNLYRYVPQLAFIRSIGVWGEYISILLIIAGLSSLTIFCYTKGIIHKIKSIKSSKSSKYSVVSIDDSSSEIENAPINA